MMPLKKGERSTSTVAALTAVPLSRWCSDQTTFMMKFAQILTVSLSTRPQQLFSVILCSQNATLHTQPGTRWRCYRGMTWRSFKDKYIDKWKHVKEQLSVIDRRERWPSFPVASTPLQYVHPDRRFGSVSVLIQQLCKMNLVQEPQPAKIKTVSFISCGSTKINSVWLLPQLLPE